MYPILLTVGSIHFFSYSIFLVLSWMVFSFVFWKMLRSEGIVEQKIFDLTFFATIVSFVISRLTFVLFHLDLFSDSMLKIIALWIQPGFSLYGALISALIYILFVGRGKKIRMGNLYDAFAMAIASALTVGKVGSLLDGTEVGLETNATWAVNYIGYAASRHPIQFYELVALLIVITVSYKVYTTARIKKLPFGIVGIVLFLVLTPLFFALEYLKLRSFIYYSLSINQWMLLVLFSENVGLLYVNGGGREWLKPRAKKVFANIKNRVTIRKRS